MLRAFRATVAAVTISLLWTAAAATGRPINPAQVYCGTDRTAANVTVLGLGLGGIPAPAPTDGVVTGWAVHVGSVDGRFEQHLQVFRRLDGPVNRFLAVAESSPRMVPSNSRESFKTRIPVKSGDLFALRGRVETFHCREMFGVTSALHEGPTPVGSTYEFSTETGLGVPLEAFIEPDMDGDGYGDLTQDRCPRVPTTQDNCPAVKLRVEEAVARKRSILLRISVATTADVGVFGTVEYPLHPPDGEVNDTVLPPGDVGGTVTEMIGSDVKTVRPGRVAVFRIKLSKALRERLSERVRRRFVKAELIVSATSLAGRTVKRDLIVRLPGIAPPRAGSGN